MVEVVNFFGHAVVATWAGGDTEFAVGSMLPDFAAICGGRLGDSGPGALSAGVAFHHTTDRVFHMAPQFRALSQDATTRLRDLGVDRGPARAAGHVAVELVLDGALVEDRAAPGYLAAIADLDSVEIVWEGGEPARWAELISRLRDRGLPREYLQPELVADRVAHVLQRRPRLALDARGAASLREIMPDLTKRVLARAASLFAHVRSQLEIP